VQVRLPSSANDARRQPNNGEALRSAGCGAEGERDNLSVLRTLLALMGRDPDDFDQSSTEAATTFGMPSTIFC
jgi:hypothetical protein